MIMNSNKKTYYLGLDMGTNSVGWAVTDEQYNLIRIKGKDAWGVREFDEAKTAVDRRSKRISRRRRQREVARIGLLKTYFDEVIRKEDPNFFIRLDNSKYHAEDKDEVLESVNGIFNDDDYKDKDYFRDYPTIFHLRQALIKDVVPNDGKYARLVYLALLNMYKHRGHFLDASLSDREERNTLSMIYPSFVEIAEEVSLPVGVANELENILSDRGLSRSKKEAAINELCGFDKSNVKEKLIIKGICGLKVDGKKLFEDIETEEKVEINFSDFSYDEKVDNLAALLGENNFALVDVMKQVYDAGILSSILHGYKFLSDSRVAEYEKHANDLKLLKEVYKRFKTTDEYNAMFRMEESGSYSAYVKSVNSSRFSKDGKPARRTADGRGRDELYNKIKKDLKGIDDENVLYILDEISNETFLPKQLTPGNGVIPNQVHKDEMVVILKNAEKYLPFLLEKDESGLTTSERIIKLFSFQIPYYIGPTSARSEANHGNGWVVRKEDGSVLPWNIEDKIDIEKTQVRFIERLIRDCTYISGEKVLPKNSLEYQAYAVLNEINNLRVNGEKISVEQKQDIFNDLFKTQSKVTKNKLVKYMTGRAWVHSADELSGIDVNINNNLTSYHKFKAIWGDKIDRDDYATVAEDIVKLSTIYGDSKKMLKDILESRYSEYLSADDIKRITGIKFKDWGRLSKEFLELQGCDKDTGEVCSLIRAMWNTNNNLMELLNSDMFTYQEALQDKQHKLTKSLKEFKAEDLDEFYFSAPVKRMVWQTLLIVKEIEKFMECPPTRIFVEMTRSEDEKGDKGRKDSRAKQLIELYKNVKDDSRNWEKEILAANDDGRLRSKKLYLYYRQMGRCMYTGKPIDIEELFTTKYDIDHIYPRHYVKDDNINNNLVLVNKASNAYKSDKYPLEEMPSEVYDLWKSLHASGLINDEKYRRLTGKNPFTDEEKAGFIARQLVETSQGTKGVADLLKQLLPAPDTTVVYVKGRNVSDFRKDYDLLKSRTINDMHHAKDAYLNIVVGNVYFTKFTQNPINFIKKELAYDNSKSYHLGKMYSKDVVRNGYTAWIANSKENVEDGTICTVRKVMAKNTPLMTRLTFEAKGGFTNETLYPASKAKADNYIPFKSSDEKMQDVTKYGGFTNVSGAYFFLVEHEVKGEKIRNLEMMPMNMKDKYGSNNDLLAEYCSTELGLVNPRVCISRIKMQSLVDLNGFKVRLSGRTGNRIILRNEVQMKLDAGWNNYIHYIDKYMESGYVPTKIINETRQELITEKENIELYNLLSEKYSKGVYAKRQNPVGLKLEEGKEKFSQLELYEQCKLISEILKLSVVGPTSADLSLIGGASESGVMRYSKNISKADKMSLINQSVTGLIETEIDMLTV